MLSYSIMSKQNVKMMENIISKTPIQRSRGLLFPKIEPQQTKVELTHSVPIRELMEPDLRT